MSELEVIFYGIGVALGLVAAAAIAAAAPFAVLYAIVMRGPILLGEVFTAMGEKISAAAGSFGEAMAAVGTAIIDALASSITTQAKAVVAAITGVVQGGIDAAKRLLGIASPSKVFFRIGAFASEGMERGITAGSQDVSTAAAKMIDPQKIGGGGGGTTNVQARANVPITIQAAEDPEATAAAVQRSLRASVVGLFEDAAIQVSVVGANG
jgi:hypothetical protein